MIPLESVGITGMPSIPTLLHLYFVYDEAIKKTFSSFSSWTYFIKYAIILKNPGAQKRNYHFTTAGAS